LTCGLSFETLETMTISIHQNLLKANAALILRQELGRRPTDQELQLLLRVVSKAWGMLEGMQGMHRDEGHEGQESDQKTPLQAPPNPNESRGGSQC